MFSFIYIFERNLFLKRCSFMRHTIFNPTIYFLVFSFEFSSTLRVNNIYFYQPRRGKQFPSSNMQLINLNFRPKLLQQKFHKHKTIIKLCYNLLILILQYHQIILNMIHLFR